MNEKLFIPVLLGTNREGRRSGPVAEFMMGEIKKRDDVETSLIDPRDFEFRAEDYGGEFPEYAESIDRAGGLVIVVPEYNHGYPGVLKEILDIDEAYDKYKHKAVGLVGVSSGNFGGARAVEALTPVLSKVGFVVSSARLYFPNAGEQFDENGIIKDEAYVGRAEEFLNELVWLGWAMKWGRENI